MRATSTSSPAVSLQRCALTCLPSSALWPVPFFVDQDGSVSDFDVDTVQVVTHGNVEVDQLMNEAVQRQVNILKKKQGKRDEQKIEGNAHQLQIQVALGSDSLDFNIDTDEGYYFNVHKTEGLIKVEIFGATYFGCRHAVETLFQLADWDPFTRTHIIADEVRVEDSPVFPHRGVMLDTARHFISVEKIKELIDSMSYSKLNLLHWHITDVQSFPLVLNSHPDMALYGAYSPDRVYTVETVSEHQGSCRGRLQDGLQQFGRSLPGLRFRWLGLE